MKHKSNSQFAFSNPRFLIGLLLVLISVSLALVGSGAVSKASGDARESMRSPQTAAAIANAQPLSKDVTIRNNPGRYLDEKGNRAGGIRAEAAPAAKHRAERPVRAGAWPHLVHRVVMSSKPPVRKEIPTSRWLASHRVVGSVARSTVPVTKV